MTKVKCSYSGCEYCTKGICQKEEIELDDICLDWLSHVEVSKEYNNIFYKHIRDNKTGKEYKKEARGKRYEMLGFVWYTDEDDREGIEEISFTEEVSGMKAQGKSITEENMKKIMEKLTEAKPVKDLPEIDWEEW